MPTRLVSSALPAGSLASLAALAALFALTAGPLATLGAQNARPASAAGPTADCVGDVLDPRLFVNVVERVSRKPVRIVYSATQARAVLRDHNWKPSEEVETRSQSPERSREVSENSRLDIQFDREWLHACGAASFEGTLSISAKAIRGSKTQPIEVPGYSQIGKDSSPANVRVENMRDIASALHEIADLVNRYGKESTDRLLAAAHDSAVAAKEATAAVDTLRARADLLERRRAQQGPPDAALRQLTDSLLGARARGLDSAGARHVQETRAIVADSLAHSTEFLARLQAEQDRYTLEVASLRAQASAIAARLASRRVDTALVAAEVLRDLAPDIEAAFRRLKAASNGSGYHYASALTGRSTTFTEDEVTELLKTVQGLPTTLDAYSAARGGNADGARTRLAGAVSRTLAMLTQLNVGAVDLARTRAQLFDLALGTLRDAEIVLPASGISTGDVLELTIANVTASKEPARVLTIRVRARDFGSIFALRDAALLVRRLGVSDAENQVEIARQLAADPRKSVTTPDPVNYQATAGAALQFGYVPREGGLGPAFVRWLQPSLGLVVAAPQFTETVTNRGVDDKLETKTNKRALDIGTGVIAGFFGDKVSLSYGRVLTAPSKKSFVAIGFSFVSLANGVLSLAKAEQ
jgi:hypothetical protein